MRGAYPSSGGRHLERNRLPHPEPLDRVLCFRAQHLLRHNPPLAEVRVESLRHLHPASGCEHGVHTRTASRGPHHDTPPDGMRRAVRKLAAAALESASDPVRPPVHVQPLVRDTILIAQHLVTPRGERGEDGAVVNAHVMECLEPQLHGQHRTEFRIQLVATYLKPLRLLAVVVLPMREREDVIRMMAFAVGRLGELDLADERRELGEQRRARDRRAGRQQQRPH
mmetsp:Transcript_7527/g.31333  ORF Transcript_7527/g.31333 Transcript_7527/m.31333 type:complete len:225 (-) Transcript_7527:1424-2098(-)